MRLSNLDSKHKLHHKLMFRLAPLLKGMDIPDVGKIMMYRSDFFGKAFGNFTQSAMRGDKHWSVGELELFAGYVSKLNQCPF